MQRNKEESQKAGTKPISFMAGNPLILWDFVLSFMWVWSGALLKIFVYKILGFGSEPRGEIIRGCLAVLTMFVFASLGRISRGAAYNPLTVLPGAISGSFGRFLLSVGVRIPTQVIGSIIGVQLILWTFPEIGHGPRLNVDIHKGALTEGCLTFTIIVISLGAARSSPDSFFLRTWTSSLSKLALHILGSDLTGGCMNPASAMGWAYARGDYMTKEHLYVYWLAPIEATLLGLWTFKLIAQPEKKQELEIDEKDKSD
ncbi:PREDICTED: probable aquaporin SIP2-1 [Nelumbo nucifera]|uniref:Probable aquaporin SIP2-1 n=1 Tax=Nelumbo nucifera TaxID=4432 RepID=A0A1U7ZTR5_NELNU|nr:PREDICTED: probable aquaporin SIP2-1 [Nelumbo nucifera]